MEKEGFLAGLQALERLLEFHGRTTSDSKVLVTSLCDNTSALQYHTESQLLGIIAHLLADADLESELDQVTKYLPCTIRQVPVGQGSSR